MKNKKLLTLLVVLGLSVACTASADFSLSNWRQSKDITGISISEPEYVKVDFDNELGATGRVSDIRIIDSTNQEVPYKIVSGKDINYDAYENSNNLSGVVSGSIIDSTFGNNKTVVVVDSLLSKQILNKLEIVTNTKNVKGRVSVYSADKVLNASSPDWRLILGNGYIYQYHDENAGVDIGSGVVSFPKSIARYYKIVIDEESGQSLKINQVKFSYQTERHNQTFTVLAPVVATAENKDKKVSDLVIDRGSQGLAVNNIALKLLNTDKNFTRSVAVFASNSFVPGKEEGWREVGRGSIYGIKAKLFSGSGLSIGLNDARERYLRVVIYNGDDQPVAFGSDVVLSGIQDSIIFKAEPTQKYKLYFGNGSASAPQYDLNNWFKYLDIPGFSTVNLGVATNNSEYVKPTPEPLPFKDQYPYAVNAILIATVLIIGSIAYSYIRKIRK